MKVLITGGSGHLGGAVRHRLEIDGADVVSVSRTGEVRADLAGPDFAEKTADSVVKCDVIVHCAAAISKSLTDRDISLVNCAGTQEIIRAAGLLGVKRMIYISSLPVIGAPVWLPVDEEHPVNPPTAYHAAKFFGEHLMRLACNSSLSTASLRITSPVGPGTPRGRIFSEFVWKARMGEPLVLAGAGGRRQNYVDVRDVAAAVALCIRSNARGVYNVAGASSVSNLELARACVLTLGSSSAISFSGAPDAEENVAWDVSIAKARAAFGYDPACTLADSISSAAASYESGVHQ